MEMWYTRECTPFIIGLPSMNFKSTNYSKKIGAEFRPLKFAWTHFKGESNHDYKLIHTMHDLVIFIFSYEVTSLIHLLTYGI